MAKSIKILNPDDLIPWVPDVDKLRRDFPELEARGVAVGELTSPGELEDLELPDLDVVSYAKDIPCVSVTTESGQVFNFTYMDIARWNGPDCDGYSVYSDGRFIYFLIARVASQAGSLGIWSIESKEWVCSISDECLCVEAVLYLSKVGRFLGRIEWAYPLTPHRGETLFLVDKAGNLSEIALEETDPPYRYDAIYWRTVSFSSRPENAWMAIDHSETFICLCHGNSCSYFRVPVRARLVTAR
ncbi:hypothetical protein [Microvirga massiliensis]|uniref:hypothetical protein n=1 Tax=Microvirga massiliensis TaxID=1033741 RepID=UPI000B286902|nr:hypothetical protein [Microvirga massiliensis]